MDALRQHNTLPWPLLLALATGWFAVSRMLSPQWSVYSQYNYGWAVPFLSIYLLSLRWGNRPERNQPQRSGTAWGGLMLVGLLMLPTRIIVEANPIWRVGSWALSLEMVMVTLAVVYLVGGRSWLRHFWIPIAFFLVAVPWPSQWENALVQALTRMNTAAVVELLAVFGIPAIKHGNVIEISRGMVGIDEACSGIRSLQATLMIGLFFGELYRLSWGRRAALVASGLMIALGCNLLRTYTLVWISNRSGNDVMEQWHDPTGIAILLGCFTLLWLLATKLRQPEAATPNPSIHQLQGPRWLPAALCAGILVVEGVNAAWFGWREQAQPGLRNWSVRWPVGKEKLREVELSKRVRTEMAFDEGRSVSWREADGTAWQMFHFSWGPARGLFDRIRVQFAKTHRPENCLPASGRELRETRGQKIFAVNGLQLPFQSFQFTDRGVPLFVYFCAWEDGPQGMKSFMRENVASRLAAAKAGSRSISQRVFEIAVWGNLTTEEADLALQKRLDEIITRLKE